MALHGRPHERAAALAPIASPLSQAHISAALSCRMRTGARRRWR